jgi:hypothetical protein
MFGLEMSGTPLFWFIFGCAIGLLVELMLFKGACALADVTDPSWLVSFLIVLFFFGARSLTAHFLFDWMKTEVDGIPLYLLAFLASGAIVWIVCAGVYALVLSVSLKKSFVTSSAQAVLDALVGSLAIGITLFVLSLVQIKQGPANKSGQAPAGSTLAVR